MSLVDIFKTLVWDAIVSRVISVIFASMPLLAWGPIGLLVGWVVRLVGDYLFTALKDYVSFEKIILINDAHKKAYDLASVKLYELAKTKGTDSDEFKAQRELDRLALSTFVQFGH